VRIRRLLRFTEVHGWVKGNGLGKPRDDIYQSGAPNVDMVPGSVTAANAGGGQQHENRPPFLTVNWCIATQGIFPSRS